MGLEKLLPEQEKAFDGLQRILCREPFGPLPDMIRQLLEGGLDTEQKELVFVGIVVVHHALGDAVDRTDALHGHLIVSAVSKFLHGSPQDLPPAAGLALLLGHAPAPSSA